MRKLKYSLIVLIFAVTLGSKVGYSQTNSISINAGITEFNDLLPLPFELEATESDVRVLSYSMRLNRRVWENSNFEFDIGLQYS